MVDKPLALYPDPNLLQSVACDRRGPRHYMTIIVDGKLNTNSLTSNNLRLKKRFAPHLVCLIFIAFML